MRVMGRHKAALAGLVSIAMSACTEAEPATSPAPPPLVDQAKARSLALAKYRQLFTNRYFRDHRDGSYHDFPPLDEQDFTFVESVGDAWLVRCDPPAGYYVRARVAKSGDWVELNAVGFARH